MEPNVTPLNSVTISTEEYIRLIDAERAYRHLTKQMGKIAAKLPSDAQRLFFDGDVEGVRTIESFKTDVTDVVLTFRRVR